MLLIPDISEWEPNADLAGIKRANGGAVILRAAYGASHPDKCFTRYRAQAAALGYAFTGLYHYVTAGEDITAQARAFLAIVGRLAPHEVPILDLEEGAGDQLPRASAWLVAVDGALGLSSRPLNERSWLYSGLDYAQSHGLAPVFASARHTWVAAFGPQEPALGHVLWQSTNGAVGSNITDWPGAGKCDTSLFHGDLAQLAALSGRYPPPSPQSPVTWTSTGTRALRELCASLGTSPAAVLEHTAWHGPFAPPTARWLDAVLSGTLSPAVSIPAGVVLVLPFQPPPR